MGVVKISDELDNILENLAKKSGRSKKDIVEEAIRLYVLGSQEDKAIKSIQGRIIVLQYPSKCGRCRKDLGAGEPAYWSKIVYTDNTSRSYVLCLDCYYSESGLAEYYVKKKQMEAIVRGLKRKADSLVKQIEFLTRELEILNIKNDIIKLYKDFKQYLLETNLNVELQKVDQFLQNLNHLIERVEQLESSIKLEGEKVVKRVKRVREVVE